MEKYGFVYIWYDSARSKRNDENHLRRWYIGQHWGTEDDGYICSSNWMRDAMRRRPQDFKRRVISKHITQEETIEEELKWLKLIKSEELGKRYYNLKNIRYSGSGFEKRQPWNKGKIGVQVAWNKGIPHTEEDIEKMKTNHWSKSSLANIVNEKIKSTQFGSGREPWNKGKSGYKTKPATEERKEKARLGNLGKHNKINMMKEEGTQNA